MLREGYHWLFCITLCHAYWVVPLSSYIIRNIILEGELIRRIVASILILCMVGSMGIYAAESIEALTYEERKTYIANALSIETKDNITVSGGAYDWGYGYISSHSSGETTTEWIPYIGPMQISRADFFRITGYDEFAEFEESIANKNRTYSTVGWSLLGAGSALTLAGLIWGFSTMSNMSKADEIGSITLLSVGLAAMCTSIPFFCIETKSNISIQFAVGIANNYNQRLLESF